MNHESSRYYFTPKIRYNIRSNTRKTEELFSLLEQKIESYDQPTYFSSFDSSAFKVTRLASDALDKECDFNYTTTKTKITVDMPSDSPSSNLLRTSYSKSKGFKSVSSSPEPLKSTNLIRYIRSQHKPIYITSAHEDRTPHKKSTRSSQQSPVLSIEEEEQVISNVQNKLNQHRRNISKQAMDKYRTWNKRGIFPSDANKLRYQSLVAGKMDKVFKTRVHHYYESARNDYLESKSIETETGGHERSRSTVLEKIEGVAVRKLAVPVQTAPRKTRKLDVPHSIHYNASVKLLKRMVKPMTACNNISMHPVNAYI